MYQYFIVTVTLAIVSSILFAHYLDKKSMTKKHKVMAVVFCSISVAILSSFFPIISGAILDMTTRINEILHINLWTGFSYTVIFIVYLGGILILSVYLSTIVIGENDESDESDENNQNPISYIFMLMHKLFSRIGHPALKPATNESAPIENSRTNNYHVPVLQETVGVGQIMLQKPVDSDKNIDTIGIGTIDINGENTGTQDGEFKENEITDQVNEEPDAEFEVIEQTDIVEEEIETSEATDQTDSIEEEIEVQESVIEESEITEQEEETIEATTESDIDQLEVIEDIDEDISIEEEPETCEAESEIAEQADSLFDHISDEINADTINEVDRLIEHAFMLKASGDLEGAIVNYMYALEHDIDDQVVFWLVLDICVLYKQLGKSDLAKDILESYVANYGSIMNDDVKAQIICNL